MGHIWIDGEDAPCACGNRGCLEELAGGAAIARKGAAVVQNGASEYLKERLQSAGEITAVDIGQAAMNGDQAAMSILIDSGRKIGTVLAKMVNFINPSLIVIGGGLANLGDRFISTIREMVYSRSLPLATSELVIRRSALMGTAGVIGAATMVLDEVLAGKAETARVTASA